jgi:hypothetical protein
MLNRIYKKQLFIELKLILYNDVFASHEDNRFNNTNNKL